MKRFAVYLLASPERTRLFIGNIVAERSLQAAAIACRQAGLRRLACPNYTLEVCAEDGSAIEYLLSNFLRRKRGGDLFAYQQNSPQQGGLK